MAIIKKFRIKSFKNIEPLLEVKNISISFETRKILDNISFRINPGEILGLLDLMELESQQFLILLLDY